MIHPTAEEEETHDAAFAVAHREAKRKGFTGSLSLASPDEDGDEDGDGERGTVTYLAGWPIYAEYDDGEEAYGSAAIRSMRRHGGPVKAHVSRVTTVRMFRNYVEFIGRDARLIGLQDVDRVYVGTRVIVTDDEEIELPEGVRAGYTFDERVIEKHFERTGKWGYAISNDEVMVFEEGEKVERRRFKHEGSHFDARMESEEGLGALDCEYVDIHVRGPVLDGEGVDVKFVVKGWEVVETGEPEERGEDEEDGEGEQESRGVLGRLMGR